MFSQRNSVLHAVIVGIDDYVDPAIGELAFAKRDASALADLLESSEYHRSTQVYSLLDRQATRASVVDVLGKKLPTAVSEGDVVLFFFAGHGTPELAGSGNSVSRYLVCHDSRLSALRATTIDVGGDIPRLMAQLRAWLIVFVSDACFSGYSGGRGIVGPELDAHRRANRPAVRLAGLSLGAGVVSIAAADDDEVAWESAELGHGVFSYFFRNELSRSEPGSVGLATLYDSVYRRVREFSFGRQNPVLSGRVAGAALPFFGVRHKR